MAPGVHVGSSSRSPFSHRKWQLSAAGCCCTASRFYGTTPTAIDRPDDPPATEVLDGLAYRLPESASPPVASGEQPAQRQAGEQHWRCGAMDSVHVIPHEGTVDEQMLPYHAAAVPPGARREGAPASQSGRRDSGRTTHEPHPASGRDGAHRAPGRPCTCISPQEAGRLSLDHQRNARHQEFRRPAQDQG